MVVISFRFDTEHTKATRHLLRKWLKAFTKSMLAEEIGDETKKPHYQGLLYTDKNIETIRRNRPLDLKGSQYSISLVKKVTEYESYLTKEKLIFYKGYSDDYIRNIPPWVKIEPKKKKVSFLENIVRDFKMKYPNYENDNFDIDLYCKFVHRSIRRYIKCPNKRICEDLVCGLLMQVSKRFSRLIYKDFYSDLKLWLRNDLKDERTKDVREGKEVLLNLEEEEEADAT